MTPAQREQLNRFLAEKVMGWEVKSWGYLGCAYVRTTGSIWAHEWSPISSWADCELLLNKIERDGWEWEWSHNGGSYGFRLEHARKPTVGVSKHRTEALCLAIARCYGWKEEG